VALSTNGRQLNSLETFTNNLLLHTVIISQQESKKTFPCWSLNVVLSLLQKIIYSQ